MYLKTTAKTMDRDFKNAQIILGLAFNSNYTALSFAFALWQEKFLRSE